MIIDDYLTFTLDWCEAWGLPVPDDIVKAIKTPAYYRRVLWGMTRDLYNGDMSGNDFVNRMIDLISDQFRRAWNEGGRAVGVEPEDQTDQDRQVLEARILQEFNYVDKLASDIEQAREAGNDIDPFQARIEMWVNRYNEVVDLAKTHFGGREKLIWRRGATERGCDTCIGLDGIVAFAEIWAFYNIRPKSNRLVCNGYNCDCSLTPTDERMTRNAAQRIEAALAGR